MSLKLMDKEDALKQVEASESILQVDERVMSNGFELKESFLKATYGNYSLTNSSDTELVKGKIGETQSQIFSGTDAVIFAAWKNTYNISARLIEHYDEVVMLECLIDKEEKVYETREYQSSLFLGYDLIIGSLFFLRYFERKNEVRLEVHNDPRLTSLDDFPKTDFKKLFNESKLFKKRD
ncbi:MAG: hypothetical protein JNL23_08200 [Chitinophagaceae bacterium]|nr:hypothetical protein [Chitinophagaceae bacterium]